MAQHSSGLSFADLDAFVALLGTKRWKARLATLGGQPNTSWSGRALLQRHAIELMIERLRRTGRTRPPSPAERCVASLVGEAVRTARALSKPGRERLDAALLLAMQDGQTLVPLFHLLRTAALQRRRGFIVEHAGLEAGEGFDLLLRRDGVEAEIACDVVSAEEGRDVHRGAWFRLMDRIDPELNTWLAAHPGRYLLKMTLPQGLKSGPNAGAQGGAATDTGGTRGAGTRKAADPCMADQPGDDPGDPGSRDLAALHRRISALLSEQRRADHDEAAVLRLDPLLLAGAQADDAGLMSSLRREFGPEAHLAVTAAGGGVFAMAARAGKEDSVAVAVRRRMTAIAPERLSGQRPGILAMFIEDTDRQEWRLLRERLQLEGEARQFLTNPAAKQVVAVSCTSRHELFGLAAQDAAQPGAIDAELRFRNPGHPAARMAALGPAVLSSP